MRRKAGGAKYGEFGWKTGKEDNCLRMDRNIWEREELFGSDRLGNNQESQNGIKEWKMSTGQQGKHSKPLDWGTSPLPRGWGGNPAPGDVSGWSGALGNHPGGRDGLDPGTPRPREGVQGAWDSQIWENLGTDSRNCRVLWVGNLRIVSFHEGNLMGWSKVYPTFQGWSIRNSLGYKMSSPLLPSLQGTWKWGNIWI